MFSRITQCRACGGHNLAKVLDLGCQPLANDFKTANDECAGYAPLEVLFCHDCTLAQLSVVVKPELLYRDYPYVTGTSEMMKKHFINLWSDIDDDLYLKCKGAKEPWPASVLEIGSNNGEFLIACPWGGAKTLGIELARNLAQIANERGVKTIARLWDESTAMELAGTGYRAAVIVARHVFAHVNYWKGFINALEMVSHKDTLVVIEVPYVGDMLKMNSFDQIYHEHLSYVSIKSIGKLMEGTKFYISSVKRYSIHGGCIGLFIRVGDSEKHGDYFPEFDESDLFHQWDCLETEHLTMTRHLKKLLASIHGKTVCGFGASAKATVWINACGFTEKNIAFVCDSTEQKQGKLVPGTRIPVVPESRLMEADYAVCFSWNFFPEIREKFKAFEEKGGKWILPVPEIKIAR